MRKEQIINNLHRIEREDPLINEITESIGLTLNNLDDALADFKRQLNIDTATWALRVYERELGITVDVNKPISERRSQIKGKIRGSGKVGAAEIKLTAESWVNGDVEVSFDGDLNIRFISEIGTPSNISDLKKQLEDMKPAHLKINYILRYISYNELSGMTWNQFQSTNYDQLARRA